MKELKHNFFLKNILRGNLNKANSLAEIDVTLIGHNSFGDPYTIISKLRILR